MAKDNNLEFEVPIYIWRPQKLRGASLPVLEQTGLSIRDGKGNLLGVDWRGMVTDPQSGPRRNRVQNRQWTDSLMCTPIRSSPQPR